MKKYLFLFIILLVSCNNSTKDQKTETPKLFNNKVANQTVSKIKEKGINHLKRIKKTNKTN